jgi:hypothetical protein
MSECVIECMCISAHLCVCVCVCVREREREREPFQSLGTFSLVTNAPHSTEVVSTTLHKIIKARVNIQDIRMNFLFLAYDD